jgi:hypothetical protein
LLVLTKHAAEAIRKRNIAVEWIERAVAGPDFSAPDPDDQALTRSFKAISEARGKVLRVVHRPDGNDIVIVTVHFDRNARP